MNPFSAARVRLSLRRPDVFAKRTGAGACAVVGNLKLMIPMSRCRRSSDLCRALFEQACDELIARHRSANARSA